MTALAQEQVTNKNPQANKQETLSFRDRWAFRTNMVDWVLLTPNIGVEYDLSNSVYGKWTLGAQVAWNGSTETKTGQNIQVKLNDYRVEVKKHKKPGLDMKPGQKRLPRFWRTYYWGAYAAYGEYNLLWSKGKKGQYYSAGLTGGWEVPLYGCKRVGEVALDLGISIGMLGTKYDNYRMDNGQVNVTKSKGWHVLPYPVPTEIKVGLVYRFESLKNKYKNR